MAAGLIAIGLKRGDRLGIWGPNTYEWYLTQMAAAKAGLILVSFFFLLSIFTECFTFVDGFLNHA